MPCTAIYGGHGPPYIACSVLGGLTRNFFHAKATELSLGFFLAALFGLLAAEFPDEAARAEFAVDTGVGAGLAQVQALLAVTELHFLAADAGLPVRVKAAFVHQFHACII
jgi:hypothetical protein